MAIRLPSWVFPAFKYSIYVFLLANVYFFFDEESTVVAQTVTGPMAFGEFFTLYSATIDTAAWVILLYMFELETSVLSDDKIKGLLKWSLHGLRAFCYIFILVACYGYMVELGLSYNYVPYAVDNLCTLVGQNLFVIETFDEYTLLDAANCAPLVGQPLFIDEARGLIGDGDKVALVQRLAWTDVINGIDWILIVIILEGEVLLQLKGQLTDRLLVLNKYVKFVLYSVLLLAAIYWGFDGDFLDFWDSFLWLAAFVFIEMNIFEWHAESEEEAHSAA